MLSPAGYLKVRAPVTAAVKTPEVFAKVKTLPLILSIVVAGLVERIPVAEIVMPGTKPEVSDTVSVEPAVLTSVLLECEAEVYATVVPASSFNFAAKFVAVVAAVALEL